MTRLDAKSISQINAEAISRRDSVYLSEHYGSRGRRDAYGRPLQRPRGLIALLHWFEAEWFDQAPDELHKRDLWREYVAANEQWARAGGGSVLGTHAWSEGMRRLLEAPASQDRDGFYVHPLAAALRHIERRDGYMATFLRAIALAGFQVSPVALRCGLPESVAMVYATRSLEDLWHAYRIEPPARPLTLVVSVPQSGPSDELSLAGVPGEGVASVPSDDRTPRLSPSPAA